VLVRHFLRQSALWGVVAVYTATGMAADTTALMLESPAIVWGQVLASSDGAPLPRAIIVEVWRGGTKIHSVDGTVETTDGRSFFRVDVPAAVTDDGTVSWSDPPARTGGTRGDILKFRTTDGELTAKPDGASFTWDNRAPIRVDVLDGTKAWQGQSPVVWANVGFTETSPARGRIRALVRRTDDAAAVELAFSRLYDDGRRVTEATVTVDTPTAGAPVQARAIIELDETASSTDYGGRWHVAAVPMYGPAESRWRGPRFESSVPCFVDHQPSDDPHEPACRRFVSLWGFAADEGPPDLGTVPAETSAQGTGARVTAVRFGTSPWARPEDGHTEVLEIDGEATAQGCQECTVDLLCSRSWYVSTDQRLVVAGFAGGTTADDWFERSHMLVDCNYYGDDDALLATATLELPLRRARRASARRSGTDGVAWTVGKFLDVGNGAAYCELRSLSLSLGSADLPVGRTARVAIEDLYVCEPILSPFGF